MEIRRSTYFVLAALLDGPLHGYAIIGRAAELSGGEVRLSTGTLFGALDRLVESGPREAAGEAVSLVGAGVGQRLRAERGMSVRSGVALVAQLLALVNLAVALCGISLVVDTPSYRLPPRPQASGWLGHGAYTLDWWWIAF